MSYIHYIMYGLGLGALHALSGPDHLISLLPFIFGRRYHMSFCYGALWGMGHGISTTGIGIATYILKYSILPLSSTWLESMIDIVIGFTLLMIGIIGLLELKNNNEIDIDDKKDNNAVNNTIETTNNISKIGGILTNGIVLGLSWDAIPSLTPSVSINSWTVLLMFLLFYALGTLLAISISCAVIGESTYFILNDILSVKSKLPIKLAFGSSITAVILGIFWIIYAYISYNKSSLIVNELNDGRNNITMISFNSLLNGNIFYYLSILGIALMIILIVYKKNFLHKVYSKYQ